MMVKMVKSLITAAEHNMHLMTGCLPCDVCCLAVGLVIFVDWLLAL